MRVAILADDPHPVRLWRPVLHESKPLRQGKHLIVLAWAIADELGWAKTYDTEYLAVARLSNARLLTLDRRMLGAAERLGIEIAEL